MDEKTMATLLARAEAAEEKVQAYALRVERQEEQIGDLCKVLDESRAQVAQARRIVAERQGRLTTLQTGREDLRAALEDARCCSSRRDCMTP